MEDIKKAFDDLQTIKSFINEGRNKLNENGFFLLFWGILIPVATVGGYLISISGNPAIHMWYWPVMMGAGGIVSAVMGIRMGRKSEAKSFVGKLNAMIWFGVFISSAVIFATAYLSGTISPLSVISPICLILGFSYWLHGAMLSLRWFQYTAMGWWITAIVAGMFDFSVIPWIMAGATFLFTFIPGLILFRTQK